ncbi:MAG: hypothetical protein QM811_14545 [Pirellulales bacterium]
MRPTIPSRFLYELTGRAETPDDVYRLLAAAKLKADQTDRTLNGSTRGEKRLRKKRRRKERNNHMSNASTRSIADLEGPWLETDFNSGLIERCKRGWYTPIKELSNELLATYLRQEVALELILPEARIRIESGFIDETESYEDELRNAFDSASKSLKLG